MTIGNNGVRVAYAGNAATTAFPVPFAFFTADEIEVWSLTAGVFTRLTRGTHYNVTGGLGATGTITAVTAPAIGTSWSFRRATRRTQLVNYTDNDPFDGDTTEGALDRAVAIAQELEDGTARSLRVPVGEATIAALPTALLRANRNLTFDALGAPTASLPIATSVAVSVPMQPVLGAANLITARSLMGARRHVNVVTDFGATGNGVTDDRAAIQAAINSLTAGLVYFPPGVYALGTGLTLKPSVVLAGDDPYLATLLATAPSISLLSYVATATAGPFAIRRLGFSAGVHASVSHIFLNGTDNAKRCSLIAIEDTYHGSGAFGVDLRHCANAKLESVKTNTTAIGIYLDNCADSEINGGWSQNGAGQGIYVVGGPGAFDEGVRITGYSTNGQVRGIEVSGQDWGQITGCSLTTASDGPLRFVNSTNWKVTGCQLATGGVTPAAPGLTCDALCTGLQIDNNLIPVNTFGVNMLGSEHVISNNRFTGNSNVDINVQASRCVVVGNICASSGVAGSIVEQAGSDFNNVSANTTNGTVTIVGAGSRSNGDNLVY